MIHDNDMIEVELAPAKAATAFALDPVRLDCCGHGILTVFPQLKAEQRGVSYLPVQMDEAALLVPGGVPHSSVLEVVSATERTIVGNYYIRGAANELIAILRGVRFQAVPVKRVTALEEAAFVELPHFASGDILGETGLAVAPGQFLADALARGLVPTAASIRTSWISCWKGLQQRPPTRLRRDWPIAMSSNPMRWSRGTVAGRSAAMACQSAGQAANRGPRPSCGRRWIVVRDPCSERGGRAQGIRPRIPGTCLRPVGGWRDDRSHRAGSSQPRHRLAGRIGRSGGGSRIPRCRGVSLRQSSDLIGAIARKRGVVAPEPVRSHLAGWLWSTDVVTDLAQASPRHRSDRDRAGSPSPRGGPALGFVATTSVVCLTWRTASAGKL